MIATSMQPPSATSTHRAERVVARCRTLALETDVPGETTRNFLTPAAHRVHEIIAGWMETCGMSVRIDAAGNLRGLLASATPNAPRLLIGSHLDTIPNAGAFDGILGVVLGVSLVEELVAQSKPLPFDLEVIGFSEEEGVRFAKPFIGSLALIGELDPASLTRTDREGVSIATAIRSFGLDPTDLPAAVADPRTFGYLELHIEQGPVLESEDCSLGIVEAILGQSRIQLTFTGQSNHAGTTPMGPLRHDAVASAAQWIVEVERYANDCSGLVATVGKVEAIAGASNVIAGNVSVTLDVRHSKDPIRHATVEHMIEAAKAAAAPRGVHVQYTTVLDQLAVPMDPALTALLEASAAHAIGLQPRRMPSGAGHDATIVARRIPCAMLFLRSPGGLSHHPDETVLPQDVEAAIAAGVEFLRTLRDDSTTLARLTAPRAKA